MRFHWTRNPLFIVDAYSAAVLLFVWLLAMAGGLAFKRYALGAKGWEQVPLIDWYRAFGNLQAVSFLTEVASCINFINIVIGWL